MAEVSSLHRREECWPEEGYFPLSGSIGDVDSFCFQNDFPMVLFDLDDESGLSESECEDTKYLLDGEGGYQTRSVADLFEYQGTEWEYDSERFEEYREVGIVSEYDSEEFEVNLGDLNDGIDDSIFQTSESERDEYQGTQWECDSERVEESGSVGGHREIGMVLEYDSDEFEVNFIDGIDDSIFQTSENERDESEWEEAGERMNYDETEALSTVINQIEEISVSADIMSGEENLQSSEEDLDELGSVVEWEVLLSLNGLGRNFDYGNSEETNMLAMEHDILFGQLAWNGNSIDGSPPAAKFVLANLPMVVLTKEELGKNSGEVVCAVCKEGVGTGETITRLPCSHLFHGDCIVPWLRIRNTCPVCRYQLPTDDAEYERKRNENGNDFEETC